MYRLWLTQNTKHKSGFELKQITAEIHHTKTDCKRQLRLIELIQWEEKYGDFINKKPFEQGYIRVETLY
jgi:hypothetical protein